MIADITRRLASLVRAAAIALLILLVVPRPVAAAFSTSFGSMFATSVVDETETSVLVHEIQTLSDLELARFEGQVYVDESVPARISASG